ncbi:hypothetical protein EG68_07410 [Paragonimus skrjabini miyazakii]|uniref:Uncharacterized protein n=1 Tax=Paragonimus skrjabini miyazakii TaxID=59628 RepID=A0A8S9YQH1_9TREM|nr:hypothetical protein EG68_07410 [Paragonimus skrjabini miyazakii]
MIKRPPPGYMVDIREKMGHIVQQSNLLTCVVDLNTTQNPGVNTRSERVIKVEICRKRRLIPLVSNSSKFCEPATPNADRTQGLRPEKCHLYLSIID